MPSSLGTLNPGTRLYKHGSGTDTDAALRRSRNRFNLATDADPAGGTSNSLLIGTLKMGSVLEAVNVHSTANLSALNFTVGTLANPTKYAAAQAGPAANAIVRMTLSAAAYKMDPLSVQEDIYLFPSGNLPSTGEVNLNLVASHR